MSTSNFSKDYFTFSWVDKFLQVQRYYSSKWTHHLKTLLWKNMGSVLIKSDWLRTGSEAEAVPAPTGLEEAW